MSLKASGPVVIRPVPQSSAIGITRPALAAAGVSYRHLASSNKPILLFALLIGAFGGVVSVTFRTPLYKATTTVELVSFSQNVVGTNQRDTTGDVGNVQTQVRVLTSRTLLSRVFEVINLGSTALPRPPATIFTRLRNRIPFLHQEPLVESREALNTAIKTVAARAVAASRLIEISCLSTSPEMAASFVNTLASEHIAATMAARAQANQAASHATDAQLDQAQARLREATDKLKAFVGKSGLDFFPDQTTLANIKMHTLQADVAGIQSDRIAKQALWERARNTPLENLPDVVSDPNMQGLKGQILVIRREMAPLTRTMTPEHPRVKQMQTQIDELQQELDKEEAIYLKRTQSDYEAALRQEKLLLGAYNAQTHTVSGQADKSEEYSMLRKDVDSEQQLYYALLQESNQAALMALAPSGGARVVDPANPDPDPYSPNPWQDIPIGTASGAALGYGLLVLRELMRQKKATTLFHAPGHSQAHLGVPELGVIPSAEFSPAPKKGLSFGGMKRLMARDSDEEMYENDGPEADKPTGGIWNAGGSLVLSESIRQALVSLLRARPSDHNPVYVITSAGPGEGKTMLSANLARAMAEVGHRVLLLDADVRKPHIGNLLGADDHEGLSDVLADSSDISTLSLDRYIQSTPFKNLKVMTHGRVLVETAGLLYFSPRIGQLINHFKTQFDCVLVDTAPSLLFPDARLWGKYADGIVLVVRAGVTTRDRASEACARFSDDGLPVLGTILNDWTPSPGSAMGAYYGKYYGQDSRKPGRS